MPATTPLLPLTLTERLLLDEDLAVLATWDEFLELLPHCPYRIEYNQDTILSFMGFASENHELLALNIALLLHKILTAEEYTFFGSNLALHIPDRARRYFNADCTVVKGDTERVALGKNMYAVANPVVLVEVLSPSTRNFDESVKINLYRKIPSLQQIITIDSTALHVFLQTRVGNSPDWMLRDYSDPTDAFPVLGQGSIALSELYRKVDLSE